MNVKKKLSNNQDHLKILIEIDKKSNVTQREMAKFIGISLGKLNFCILELKKKGLIKIKNFKKSKNKLKYAYILTPEGFSTKVKLTLSFMKRKMKEYDYLKTELKKSQKERMK
jgi:EPS-associated MarR family transcriptional regulator|tara:strand:+ start:1876 stop:2214 length:339 start_codon:yes stop_codon:yes gene_type:complete